MKRPVSLTGMSPHRYWRMRSAICRGLGYGLTCRPFGENHDGGRARCPRVVCAPALLYRIARCIAREGVVVTGAKISTLGVDTVDAFFVKESHGGELGDLTAQSLIRALEKELEPPSPDLPATLE